MNILQKIKINKTILLVIIPLLLLAGISHGYNMFHYPYYENDEGTYMSQAWAILTLGKLAPYTYWYDHAPVGWMFIALWVKLTGGFSTFGISVNSGRVLMLVLHLISSLCLFFISKKATKSNLPGIIAVVIFSLSPLGIYFQRRVLLDNIMIFWVLLSLALLYKDKIKLSNIILSAIFFGISVLSKENAIFFIPAFIYLISTKTHVSHKPFALFKWLFIMGLIIFTYFLYAIINGEFFPVGFLGNNTPHVSMLTTFHNQLSRGGSTSFWIKGSDFRMNLREWLNRDSFTIIAGIIATICNLILSIKIKFLRVPAMLAALFWLFLLRGSLIIDFYITPIIPILALNIGLLIHIIIKTISFNKKYVFYSLCVLATLTVSVYLLMHPIGQYTLDETKPQLEALNYVFKNVPKNAVIAIDDFAEVEYREKGYKNAVWFWKFWYDPEVQKNIMKNDWKNIQYLALSHEMLRQIGFRITQKNNILENVFLNSTRLAMFGPSEKGTYINFSTFQTTNGDWAAVYELKNVNNIMLDSSWKYFKNNYIISYGQVVDPKTGITTSEDQANAMLRAVWENDKTAFDGIYGWTKNHLEWRIQDKLFSSLWVKKNGVYQLGDVNTSSKADEDIALALLFASHRWNNQTYFNAAKAIINDIWEKEVVSVNDHYYLKASSNSSVKNGYLINPSYLSPATYRIFAEVDTKHPWTRLANDSYYLLNRISGGSKNSQITLPPNWIVVSNSGNIESATHYVSNDANTYGIDASQVLWRVTLDALWFKNKNAIDYLSNLTPFYEKVWNSNHNFAAEYTTNGTRISTFDSLSSDIAPLSTFNLANKKYAASMFSNFYENRFNYVNGYWGNGNNFSNQTWGWFGTALYVNRIPDLWDTDTNK